MPIIDTSQLKPGTIPNAQSIYNGLDCCITVEVLQELQNTYAVGASPNQQNLTYNFERALQAPVLEMMLRGFRVDPYEKQKGIQTLKKKILRLEWILNQYSDAIWSRPLNPRSPSQLKDFFYGTMNLPEVHVYQKGQRKVSTNREALEKLGNYFYAQPIVNCILALRDNYKKLSVLETEIDLDGRMRTSYNIGGTETGRFSSSGSAEGTGTNLQNITAELRKIFIADPGWKLCVIDLEQAEAREVGFLEWILFKDPRYLDACEGGDLHTLTCKLIWRDLAWTGNAKKDRAIADQLFYRDYSYRDMAKRGAHGSNYYGTPATMAKHLKVPVSLMQDFQAAYFDAFPAHNRWHRYVAQQIQTIGYLDNLFQRRRHFFGRTNDDATLREAIAYIPQSSTADRMNLGLWRIWKHMPEVQLIGQVHDAVIFQYPEEADEALIINSALNHIQVTLRHEGRDFTIPGEAKVGWNWGYRHESPDGTVTNPDGLAKFRGKDDRRRSVLLDRIL